jgi:hypothetical protein
MATTAAAMTTTTASATTGIGEIGMAEHNDECHDPRHYLFYIVAFHNILLLRLSARQMKRRRSFKRLLSKGHPPHLVSKQNSCLTEQFSQFHLISIRLAFSQLRITR